MMTQAHVDTFNHSEYTVTHINSFIFPTWVRIYIHTVVRVSNSLNFATCSEFDFPRSIFLTY
jgi:hypothetical protein